MGHWPPKASLHTKNFNSKGTGNAFLIRTPEQEVVHGLPLDAQERGRTRNSSKMAARWLPNVEDFFEGFLRLLEISENSLHSATYDNSEFLFRRLDAHERTLSTLLNRIEQTYHGVPQVHDLTRDLRTFMYLIKSYIRHEKSLRK